MAELSPALLQALQRRKAQLAQGGGQPPVPGAPAPQNAGVPQPPQNPANAPQIPQGTPQGQPTPDQGMAPAGPVDPAQVKLEALKSLLKKAIQHI
jgi:hypothetical protein